MTDEARPSYVKDKKKVEEEMAPDKPEAIMAKQILELYEEKKDLEERITIINKELDGYEEKDEAGVKTGKFIEGLYHKLASLLEAKGVDLIRIPKLGSFWTKPENYPSIIDKDGFFKFLDDSGQGAIAKRDVNWMTLRGWVNAELKAGRKLPPSLNNFTKTKISFRRANPK